MRTGNTLTLLTFSPRMKTDNTRYNIVARMLCLILVTGTVARGVEYDSAGVETTESIDATCSSTDRALWSTWDIHVCNAVESSARNCWPQRRRSLCPAAQFAGVVVLFHAFTECPFTQQQVASDLQSRCFDVLIPLLPGHGGKDCSGVATTCVDGRDVSGLPTTRAPYVHFVDTINGAAREHVEERMAAGDGRSTTVDSALCDMSSGAEGVTLCGYPNITSSDCTARGCCFSETDATCYTPPSTPFVIGVGGESTGGALATLASARSNLYTRQVVLNGFYGVTEARLDTRVAKCLHGNLGLVECLIQSLATYEGLDANAAAMVGPVVSQYLSGRAVSSYDELQASLREVLEQFVEIPNAALDPLLDSTMTWGGYCKKSLTAPYGGAGICTFNIRHLLAVHSTTQFALRSARHTRVKDAQFITVESDGVSRNSLVFSAARRTAATGGTEVYACMYWTLNDCTPSLRSHACGVPHLALNTAKAASYPPGTSYWMSDLVRNIATYFAQGLPAGTQTWDQSNTVCVQEPLDNPSPQAGGVMEQAEVVVTRPGGGPIPPPENVYHSVQDTIVINTGLGEEEGGSVTVEPPIDEYEAGLGTSTPRGGFEIFKSAKNGEIYFRLKAANYRIILASEGYSRISSAENGIRSVIANAVDVANFDLKKTDAGYSFTLLSASNKQVIARSQVYTTAAGRDNGVKSVQENAANGVVKYLDGLDEGGVFRLFRSDKNSKYYFSLKSSNGQVIGSSQGYTTKYAAKKGILSVRNNAAEPSRFRQETSTSGQFYFNLRAGNHRTILTSEMYTSREAAEAGAGAVTRLAAKAVIKDEAVTKALSRRQRLVVLEGDAPVWVISCDGEGKFYFSFKTGASLGLMSDAYPDVGSAESGLLSCIDNSQDSARYAMSSNSLAFSFSIKATNGRTLAMSPEFPSAASRDSMIKTIQSATSAPVDYTCRTVSRPHAGRFVIKKNRGGEFYFNLVSRNSRVLCTSESYKARGGAQNGVQSVRENSVFPSRFVIDVSSNGRYFFNLKARNGQVICTSQMYRSRTSARGGVGAVIRVGSTALDVDQSGVVVALRETDEQETVMVNMPGSSAAVFTERATSKQAVGSVDGLAIATISTGDSTVEVNSGGHGGGSDGKNVSLVTFIATVGGVVVVAVATILFLFARKSRSSGRGRSTSPPMRAMETRANDGTEL